MTATTETTDITVVSGPTSPGTASDWELFLARRALATLKARLGRQGLLDLLQPDLAASAKTLTACAASSGGQWRPALTQLHAEGLTSSKDTASTSPWNSPTGSPQPAYHSAGPATHPSHSR